MENEENVDLNEQIKGPIDDVTSVDIATQLSDCDDDEIKNVCRKLNAEKLVKNSRQLGVVYFFMYLLYLIISFLTNVCFSLSLYSRLTSSLITPNIPAISYRKADCSLVNQRDFISKMPAR